MQRRLIHTRGLYVHLPFCPYICPYCDFAKWPLRRSQARHYLEALGAEIAAAPALQADTVFIGGGTPNTYEPGDIVALVRTLRERFAVPAGAEISIEVNPDPGSCDGFDAYAEAGITRISIGAQAFDDRDLQVLGRRHGAADIHAAIARARHAGFASVSLDLMFGAPGTTLERFDASLEQAIGAALDHISTYGLTIEAGTPFAAWYEREPRAFAENELEAALYERAIDRLTGAGYEHYEISNFAKPGHRCRHNVNYWENGEYLGIGVGAASFLAGVRSTHTRSLTEYIDAALTGREIPGESERLEGEARAGEAAMLALRTLEGVDLRFFKQRYGVDLLERYGGAVTQMHAAGLLEVEQERMRLTRRGRFLANDVCAVFIS